MRVGCLITESNTALFCGEKIIAHIYGAFSSGLFARFWAVSFKNGAFRVGIALAKSVRIKC